MAALPAELLQRIVYFADHDTRKSLLTVSHGFQTFAEEATWPHELDVVSDNDIGQIARFTGRRARLLHRVSVAIKFPELRETREHWLKCRETAAELHANDVFFTRRIARVFDALKRVEESVLDPETIPRIELCIQGPVQRDNGEQPCDHRRYHSWRLHLLSPSALPILRCVRHLEVGVEIDDRVFGVACRQQRPVDLSVIVSLLTKLPSCKTLECADDHERMPYAFDSSPVLEHFTRPWEGPRRDSRHDFGRAVLLNLETLPALKGIDMRLGAFECIVDQSKPLPDLVSPEFSHDPVSSALRILSQGVVDFNVCLFGDSTLFWPPSPESQPTAMLVPDYDTTVTPPRLPSWPHLKRLKVELLPATPRGGWYFRGAREEARREVGYRVTRDGHYPPLEDNEADERWDVRWDQEWAREENVAPNVFRIVPVAEAVEGLLEAFARALGRMPVLEEAELSFKLYLYYEESDHPGDLRELTRYNQADVTEIRYGTVQCNEKWTWGVKYSALPGDSRRLEWRVGDWRPSERVLNLFRDAVGDVEEKWFNRPSKIVERD
ncbi:hypothetical protein B0T21DRAFT_363866 [Apiosordaria backusii]|uniref:F-box domain-containing protein n=1 Tax=Apiosordaria backusii TaxID=314023 RepID=A0AA40EI08_9PEZI|nr:hypothetical protein B0T21DRAFT_363866 [Apiosordaria backusii]